MELHSPKPTPGFTPGPDVRGNAKPYYPEGTRVKFQLHSINGEGTIVGLSSQHVIDLWLVKVDPGTIDPTLYPWSTLTVPHTLIEEIQ